MASRKKSKVVPWFSLKIVLDSTGWEMSLFRVLEEQFSLQKGWVWRDLKATFQSLQGDQQGRPGSFWQGLLGGQEPMDIMWIKRGWDFPHKDSQMLKQAVQTGLCTLSLELCKPQLNKALSNLILSPWQPHVKEEVGLQAFWDPFQPEKSYDFRIHIFLMYFYTCWVNHSYSKTPASKESQCISAKVSTHSWI